VRQRQRLVAVTGSRKLTPQPVARLLLTGWPACCCCRASLRQRGLGVDALGSRRFAQPYARIHRGELLIGQRNLRLHKRAWLPR